MNASTLAGRLAAPVDDSSVHRGAGWITAIAGKIAIVMTRETRIQRSEALARLDDHILRDIGLTRAEIAHAALLGRGAADALRLRPSEAIKEW